nr:uncharacterized protein LOC112725597 [Arachis hypogaea]
MEDDMENHHEGKKVVDHLSGGFLNKKKTIEEAIDVIETVADNEYFYACERSNNRGVMELNNVDAILAQNKMITKQLTELTKQMEKNQAAAIHTQPSPQSEQAHDPYSKTYNPGWKNHPNFGWENQQNQGQNHKSHNPNQYTYQKSNPRSYQHPHNNSAQPPYQAQANQPQHSTTNPPSEDKLSRIEAMLTNLCKEVQDNRNFKEEVRDSMQSRGEIIKKLESQVGHLSQQIPKSTDSFPNDTEKNPRGEMKKVSWEECKAVTLANEEILEENTSKPTEHSQRSFHGNLEEKEQGNGPVQGKEPKRKEILKPYVPKAPFPQRLRGGEKEKSYSRFLDMFASFSVNIPFIKTLQQMPTYIKCMKELLTKKRTLKARQTVIMNKECSALIKKDLPLKEKYPQSFHIPCAIGDTRIDRGFCDLGASINVMPLSLMKRLQINELKSTDVVIQLVDKTQKQAKGVVENVLVKVGNYFPPLTLLFWTWRKVTTIQSFWEDHF